MLKRKPKKLRGELVPGSLIFKGGKNPGGFTGGLFGGVKWWKKTPPHF